LTSSFANVLILATIRIFHPLSDLIQLDLLFTTAQCSCSKTTNPLIELFFVHNVKWRSLLLVNFLYPFTQQILLVVSSTLFILLVHSICALYVFPHFYFFLLHSHRV